MRSIIFCFFFKKSFFIQNEFTAIRKAAQSGHSNIVLVLISASKEKIIEAETSMKRTPLHIATIAGNFDVVKSLIE